MLDIQTLDQTYVASTYARFPVALTGGNGALLLGADGKEYIDLGSGIAVNTFGASDEAWLAAVVRQASQLQHTSNLYYTKPCAQLAQALCERTGMKKAFFGNSGAEANECLIKTARRHAFQKYGDERHSTIITLKNSFHGRTIATLSATGQDSFHTEFGPFTPGFVHADPAAPGDIARLAQENDCCAILFEVVQGEGGVCPLNQAAIDEIVQVASAHDLLIAVDEVQTGNGRTGKLFGYMHFGLSPDLISTAKGLGGGLPIGVCLMGERVSGVLTPGSHGSTFGGNPVSCAGALSVLSRIDQALMDEVAKKSQYILSELSGAPGVLSVTGLGLMLGVECARPVKQVLSDLIERGVLALSAKQKLRLLPPLNIGWAELRRAVAILKEVLAQ